MSNYPFHPIVNTEDGPVAVKMYKQLPGGIKSPLKLFIKQPEPYIPPDPGIYNNITRLLAKEPFYVAHRAGSANWVEFSEKAIRLTATRFYRAVEFSVYRCATGEYVLSHDFNTLRMTGENYAIADTPWSVLSTLKQTAENTTDPYQQSEPLITLDHAMELAKNMVVFIDHKPTSGAGEPTPTDLQNMNDLLDYLDTFTDGKQRFVWKCFKDGYASADAAGLRGYISWGIYYADEITTAPNRLSSFDMLGLEYKDDQIYWDVALATGKPVIAHIILNMDWVSMALEKGANGLMCAIPLSAGP